MSAMEYVNQCEAAAQAVPPRIAALLAQAPVTTPVLLVDGTRVAERLQGFRRAFPEAELLYAVKANPLTDVLSLVARAHGGGDVASAAEIRMCMDAGFPPALLSFGNPVKHADDIAFARRVGIDRFTVDSLGELEKVAEYAPGARVSVRILVNSEGAQWPLSRKFGCDFEMAVELLRAAPSMGLVPYGTAFHVGSQQTDPTQWDGPLAVCAAIDAKLRRHGVRLDTVNLGGGFPAPYVTPIFPLATYAWTIRQALRRHFGKRPPHVIIEPGRALVADAGVIQAGVLLVSKKSRADTHQWVYLDCGKFGGLAETADEAIRYPLLAPRRGGPDLPSIVAGPTCDSADILCERAPYPLPADLRAGDPIQILSAGAYTFTYSSIGFNGFAPLRTCFV